MANVPVPRPRERAPSPPPTISNNQQEFVKGELLGEGGFARCFRYRNGARESVAVKVIHKPSLKSNKQKQKLLSEIKIHRKLFHQNIVRFLSVFEDDLFVYILLEVCENKTLVDMLKKRKRLTEPETRFLSMQLLLAIKYMHSKGIIHRDIKLGNLFLAHDMNLKIGDFGLAAEIIHDGERKKTICGTPNYIAPEVLFNKDGHSFEVDIWSFGIVMYTLAIGKPPFQTKDINSIYERIRKNNLEFPPSVPISDNLKSIIVALLNSSPEHRPSIDQVAAHPFFNSHPIITSLPQSALVSIPVFDNLPPISPDNINFQNLHIHPPSTPTTQSNPAIPSAPTINPNNPDRFTYRNQQIHPRISGAIRTQSSQQFNPSNQQQLQQPFPASNQPFHQQQMQQPQQQQSIQQQTQQQQQIHQFSQHSNRQPNRDLFATEKAARSQQSSQSESASSKPSSKSQQDRAANAHQYPSATISYKPPSHVDAVPVSPGAGIVSPGFAPAVEPTSTGTYAPATQSGNSSSSLRQSTSSLEELLNTLTTALTSHPTSTTSNTDANPLDLTQLDIDHPTTFITKWIDYSNKFGFGYQLRDGTVGVYFNDSTTIVVDPDNHVFEYLYTDMASHSPMKQSSSNHDTKHSADKTDKMAERPVMRRDVHSMSQYPSHLQKKVTLVHYFRNYMHENLYRAVSNSGSLSLVSPKHKHMDYLVKYLRTRHGIMFRLSNLTLQLNLVDHTKLVVSGNGTVITYIDKNRVMRTRGLDWWIRCSSGNSTQSKSAKKSGQDGGDYDDDGSDTIANEVVERIWYVRNVVLKMVQRKQKKQSGLGQAASPIASHGSSAPMNKENIAS